MHGTINGTGTMSATVIKGPGLANSPNGENALAWPNPEQIDAMDREALSELAQRKNLAFAPTMRIEKMREKLSGVSPCDPPT